MISSDVIARAAEIRQAFQAAKPFRHAWIEGFLEAAAADALLADFPTFDRRHAINEHGDVGRKAVVESVAGISGFYRAFYRYINSWAFLDAMSALTGIENLIADESLFGGGTHENLDGQALDVHVDFNIDERRMLHRRVNLLIYLNREWDASWGGAIELHSDPWNAAANEVQSFPPLFNHALVFETNEYSWHGFKRITLPDDRRHESRKSFSIYLYTKDRPIEEVVAPHTTFYVPPPMPSGIRAGATLSEQDVAALQIAMASRDGLVRMYQKLLIEKEQRLHDVMRMSRDAAVPGDARGMPMSLSPRSWRWILALQRAKHRVARWRSRLPSLSR
jgi:hypothetical protein